MAKPTTTTTKKTMATKSAPKNGATPAPAENVAPVPAPQAPPPPSPVPALEARPRRAIKAAKAPAPAKAAAPRVITPKAVPAKRTTTVQKRTTRSKSPGKKPSYTLDDVALRAYFIAQDRHAKGIPGSPETDWLEAERQLRVEIGL